MSEVKVNKISPRSSTTVTLGDASDVFQLPASAEIDIARGATLDVNGTIDLTGATKTGFPAGGLTHASQWRLTADFTNIAEPIASNLIEVDTPVGFGVLGASMTESSGVFAFPATGYWLITFNHHIIGSGGGSSYNKFKIQTTIDHTSGPTWADANDASNQIASDTYEQASTTSYIFDVTDVTECRCRFSVGVLNNPTILVTKGHTTDNETHMTFLRLADT